MDFGRRLFAGLNCSEFRGNPISEYLTQILTGSQFPDLHTISSQNQELEDAWEQAEANTLFQEVYEEPTELEETGLEEVWDGLEPQDPGLEQLWQDAERPVHEDDSVLEQAWEEAGMQVSEEIWRSFLKRLPVLDYVFSPANPYHSLPSPLSLADQLEARNRIPEAILALEAEVQIHPESSEAWRRLGELQAECDDDEQALAALQTGLNVDPLNLDSLLAIGVSNLNEARPDTVCRYLAMWIERNPDYSRTIIVEPGEDGLLTAFETACTQSPEDSKALTALGILYLQRRNFQSAESAFSRALETDPLNHSLWNKLAASQYLQGQNAAPAYEHALDLRPTYVRAWANLASCYWRLGELSLAARFILCALALNPRDKHLWGKLATMFLLMNRLDLVKKIEAQDPYLFADEFDVVRRESLYV